MPSAVPPKPTNPRHHTRVSKDDHHLPDPPQETCDFINRRVRGNPHLCRPNFDYRAYCADRNYSTYEYSIGGTDGVAFVDAGVISLLPVAFLQSPCLPVTDASLEISQTENKGLGTFVRCKFSADETILLEHPSIVVPYLKATAMSLSELYTSLFEKLPPQSHKTLTSLFSSPLFDKLSRAEGIMFTNSIEIDLDVVQDKQPELNNHRAIFLHTSRINHSCAPNARVQWDYASFELSVIATRTINEGDEVTISYVDPRFPREARRQQLKETYGFDCQCDHCAKLATDEDSVKKSDAARLELLTAPPAPGVETWCLDTSSMLDDSLVNAHKRRLELIEQEGLEALGCQRHYDVLTVWYGALSDKKRFREWATKSMHTRMQGDPEIATMFGRWIQVPQTFPLWGERPSSPTKSKPSSPLTRHRAV
ncbi:SET domain-containing protein [Fistulina hepatica ATCC 64428]|uniref:SET domain-containing protein n=1 Tax=Fistulina hepatica ATCC 64428 TaxID=1128425 RepID=A0A0D7A4Z9_9AGAR|nr:SET domain-containing protein [Fistulina hepatica ATCC 64428]